MINKVKIISYGSFFAKKFSKIYQQANCRYKKESGNDTAPSIFEFM